MLNFELKHNGKENLVLLHGFMEDLSIWSAMEKTLSKDFTLIKVDLPGHGKSEVLAPIQDMDLMAEEVNKVLEDLEMTDVHLLGHSMGGYTALAFAEKFPNKLKSITLFFSSTLADDDEKKNVRRRSIDVIDKNFPLFVNNSIPNLFSENDIDHLESEIKRAKEIALRTPVDGVKASQLGMAERPDRTAIFDDFKEKIVVIAGKHDGAVKTDLFLDKIPNKKNIKNYVLDCGHNGHWEKPEVCSAIINTELV